MGHALTRGGKAITDAGLAVKVQDGTASDCTCCGNHCDRCSPKIETVTIVIAATGTSFQQRFNGTYPGVPFTTDFGAGFQCEYSEPVHDSVIGDNPTLFTDIGAPPATAMFAGITGGRLDAIGPFTFSDYCTGTTVTMPIVTSGIGGTISVTRDVPPP